MKTIASSKFLKKLSLIASLFLATISTTFAQTLISGVVSDVNAGAPLPFASVVLEGTTLGTVTDLNGEFRLPLDPGSYTIAVSFMGYQTQKKEVSLAEGQNLVVDFGIIPEAIMGEEVVVTAMMRGQKAAINSQLNAGGIVNTVSEEQIQELPDANAGEALGRLPGISLKRSGGEAQSVVLRGLNEKFSQIQLDGVAIPATGAGGRGVDLSLFSINSLAGIEVTKALTSDMDADAIAGSVNLITKKASSKPELRIDVGGGYNALEKSASQYSLGARYSRRFLDGLLGVQASINRESKIRSSESYSQGWDVRADSTYFINSLTASYRDETRTRTGGSLLLDFDLANGGVIRLNNFYNQTGRDGLTYQRNYPVTSNVTYSLRDSERDLQTLTNALSGEHFLGKFKLNWGASHAISIGKSEYDHQMNFVEGGASGAGMANVQVEDLKGPGELLIPYAYNKWEVGYLNTAYYTANENSDRDLNAYLNLERTVSLSNEVNITLKAGGKYRYKDRSNEVDRYRAPYWVNTPKDYQILPDGSIIPSDYTGTSFEETMMVGGANISMLNFLDDSPPSRDVVDGKYELNPMINPDLAREWYATHKNGISMDGSLEEYNPYPDRISQIYSVTERIASGYGMATMNLGKMVRVIAGVRVESESNDYTAKYAPNIAGFFRYDANEATDTSSTYSASYVLPNFHLRFKPVDWWDLRLAATKTLSRPDFSMRLPNIVVRRTGGTINRGRPDLNTTEAWNYDVISSFYSSKFGLFTVGGFYKQLDNIFYNLNGVRILNAEMEAELDLPQGYGSYVGLALNEPINTSGTELYGIEFDLQANLRFLPGFLGNFVLRGNFSIINSTTMIPRFRIDQDNSTFPPAQTPVFYESEERLEGQPSNFGNVALGYDQGGFSGRFSVFFQDDYLTSVTTTGLGDRFQKGYAKWDLALKQEIPKLKMEVMLNITNLSNFYEGTYLGYQSLDQGSITYDMLIDLALRFTL